MYIVYALEDPRDHLYHYIGITDDVYRRFQEHLAGSGNNSEKNRWQWECRQANIMILMREIERVNARKEIVEEREKYWIWHFLQLGHPLHNTQYARSLQEEVTELEHQYQGLLARKSHLVRQIHQAEKELTLVRGDVPNISSEVDEEMLVSLYKEGYTLRAIVKATGCKYYRVQKVIARRLLLAESVIEETAS